MLAEESKIVGVSFCSWPVRNCVSRVFCFLCLSGLKGWVIYPFMQLQPADWSWIQMMSAGFVERFPAVKKKTRIPTAHWLHLKIPDFVSQTKTAHECMSRGIVRSSSGCRAFHSLVTTFSTKKSPFLDPRWNSKAIIWFRTVADTQPGEEDQKMACCTEAAAFWSNLELNREDKPAGKEEKKRSSARASGRRTKFFLLQGPNISLKYPPRTAH